MCKHNFGSAYGSFRISGDGILKDGGAKRRFRWRLLRGLLTAKHRSIIERIQTNIEYSSSCIEHPSNLNLYRGDERLNSLSSGSVSEKIDPIGEQTDGYPPNLWWNISLLRGALSTKPLSFERALSLLCCTCRVIVLYIRRLTACYCPINKNTIYLE